MRLIDRSKLEMDIKKWLVQPCAPDESVMVAQSIYIILMVVGLFLIKIGGTHHIERGKNND